LLNCSFAGRISVSNHPPIVCCRQTVALCSNWRCSPWLPRQPVLRCSITMW